MMGILVDRFNIKTKILYKQKYKQYTNTNENNTNTNKSTMVERFGSTYKLLDWFQEKNPKLTVPDTKRKRQK